ncbi:hypothetical protein EC34870_3019B, partial [Escherichia coli 3.4870]
PASPCLSARKRLTYVCEA